MKARRRNSNKPLSTPDAGSDEEKKEYLSRIRAEAGRKGGKTPSEKRAVNARVNGALGGRPKEDKSNPAL